jgi:two-component system response regulator PilR (NtrC family)
MGRTIRVLLVYADDEPSQSLNVALQNLSVKTRRARSCEQARNLLERTKEPPDLVFTDTKLPDGTCMELLALGRQRREPLKIIVVARTVDRSLYMNALENGAFDIMLPPFAIDDLAFVLQCATDNVASAPADAASRGRLGTS